MVLPNGDLEVTYNNGNAPPANPNMQQLGVHCKPSGDSVAGAAHLNCAAPVKARSFNRGLTWSDAGQVNPDSGLDHYMPAVDQTPQQSDRLGVSYYRTQRVPGENITPPAGFAPAATTAS